MRKYFFPIGLTMLMALSLSVGLSWAAEDEATGGAEKDMKADASGSSGSAEVVIKGVQRLRVKVEKPEPDLKFDVDEIAVPYVKTEDTVLDISPTSLAQPAVSVPSNLNSPLSASPHLQMFQRPPLLSLTPKYKSQIAIAKWRIRITDGFGNVFKDFSGNGSLPSQIIWDGWSKDHVMADVGTSYSYIFSIIDVASNPTSQMGKPIVMESLIYDDGGTLYANLTGEVLFEKEERKTSVSKKGQLYLKEAQDLIQTRQNFPVVIESTAKDTDDATTKGELVQEYLAERMILPKESFQVVAKKGRLEKITLIIR